MDSIFRKWGEFYCPAFVGRILIEQPIK